MNGSTGWRLLAAGVVVTGVALGSAGGPARAHEPEPSRAEPGSQTSPQRIVAVGAVVVDILHQLEARDRIVAVDATGSALEPDLPNVGFYRQLSGAGVISVRPDLVLALDDAGPPVALQQIERAGLQLTRVTHEPTVDGARRRIESVARAVGRQERGRELVETLDRDLAAVRTRLSEAPNPPPRVLFVYARGAVALLVAGQDTSAHAMIELSGGRNAVPTLAGYKPLSPEVVLASAPDVLLLTENGLRALGGVEGLRKHPVLGLTPAVKNARIVAWDDVELLGFGPRLGQVALALSEKITP
jgi:iron complex transport system substrate-binding protein